MPPSRPHARHRDTPGKPARRRHSRRALFAGAGPAALWFEGNVKYVLLALTAIAVLTLALYALS
jgi:hypothetical protein